MQSDEIDAEFALYDSPKLYKKLMARGFFLVASVRKCARLKVEKRGKTRAALTKEAVALIILNRYRSNL
jgi:hypothetical protein